VGLPRAARMRRSDFRRAGRGRRVTSGPLVVQAVPPSAPPVGPAGPIGILVRTGRWGGDGTAEGPVRVGFAVGRPVGGAVVRNRVRRRLRVAAMSVLPLAHGGSPTEPDGRTLVVVRVRPGAETLPVVELERLLAQAWRRLGAPRGGRP
jgi:ribonuclease P protein component